VRRLHLVRHGHAEARWGQHPDPGLDARGRAEAEATASRLASEITPRPVVTSPMARAGETAACLARRWSRPCVVDPAFGEIPAPWDDPDQRRSWLRSALASHWDDLGPDVEQWRLTLLAAVRSTEVDTVVFTHFVAINAVVAAATADHAVTVFLPANASVTIIDVDSGSGALAVVELGSEATPEVG